MSHIPSRYAIAPEAPMPADPSVCRWCGGRRKSMLSPHDYCPNGCAKNDTTLSTVKCWGCDRMFQTGLPMRDAVMCHECDDRDKRALVASVSKRRRYEFSTYGRGRLVD